MTENITVNDLSQGDYFKLVDYSNHRNCLFVKVHPNHQFVEAHAIDSNESLVVNLSDGLLTSFAPYERVKKVIPVIHTNTGLEKNKAVDLYQRLDEVQ